MTRMISLALALGLLFAAAPHAQNSVAGAWDLAINGPEGPITAGLVLKQEGDKLTGTITSPQGEAPATGSMTGKTLALTFSVTTPQGNLDIKMSGEVDGAEMKGMLDFGMGQADFTGKKK